MRSLLLVTASALAVSSVPGFAEESGSSVASANTGIRLTFSGQVNRGVLFADDGVSNETFFVDNDNSSTRFRFTGEGDFADGWTAGVNIEIQAESNSTASVNQITQNTGGGSSFLSERKLELFFENDKYGRLTVGQGDTASNSTSEVDLSGTSIVAYSGIADFAGGILFRDGAGALTTVNIGSVVTNLDGLSRQDRVRYDAPSFGGVTLSGSVGSDGIYDVAARYNSTLGAFKVGAALAYSVNTSDDETINGSVSLLHQDTGLSLTLAGGSTDRDLATDLRDTTFGYVKVGYQTKSITNLGTTAFSIDYSVSDDVAAAGDEATSYGIAAVQHIDAIGTDLYLGVRNYELDRPGSQFQDVTAVLAGARLKF
jgi:hypothetical protein